ncbi:hypothetical protein OAK17_08710 [Alphaproteobacteria bacterium]|nr:hypothetical protein [Alphaproteobacteria bacterium]
MIIFFYCLILFIISQRLLELIYSNINTKRLLKDGAIEYGKKHYPLFIVLHSTWIISIFIYAPQNKEANFLFLIIFFIMQIARVWVLVTLGKFWTTRIISPLDQPLIKKGPYKYFKHPNYLIVCVEIAALPLVYNLLIIAILFSIANLILVFWRINVENKALNKRIFIT